MAKRGTVLGLIGLILGASGLGLGGFAWLSVYNLENHVLEQKSWYVYNSSTYATIPTFNYINPSVLTIDFELGAQESAYFSFSARVHIEPVIDGWSFLKVFFSVDAIIALDPHAEVGVYNGSKTVHFMINLQDVRDDLAPGDHNVKIYIYGSSSANYIFYSSLFVQKFPT